ncbi:MAG: adenylosuccinate lyase [Saprospiraceae bacterium]
MIENISPIDGRYSKQTEVLQNYFSEFALIKYRVFVEYQYFIALLDENIAPLDGFDREEIPAIQQLAVSFNRQNALEIKEIEKTTNHDVKAVEYFIKSQFDKQGWAEWKEMIHFGLTSQDINNTAIPLSIKDALHKVILPNLDSLLVQLNNQAQEWKMIPMLARTHGQPASPTRLGKEWMVFIERIENQISQLRSIPIHAKFGGASGNMNAHAVTFPDHEWLKFAENFVTEHLGLTRSFYTTQIEHYDQLAAMCQCIGRINTILIDFCRDIWQYISIEYFKQKTVAGEIGSSAMPHKVNPIDFENAEGNLGIANALFHHLAEKLPISRLQRDLTDSTVLRNIGVPFAHSLIAYNSVMKGLSKVILNQTAVDKDLDANWMVVAEGIQSILRREGYPQPYEALKELTRGKANIGQEDLVRFIDQLEIKDNIKEELKKITPFNYTGLVF